MTDQSNIFRIKTENELDEILNINQYKLVTVIFSSNDINVIPAETDVQLKKIMKRVLAKEYQTCIFIYVNLSDFKLTAEKYTKPVKRHNIPYTQFYWDNFQLATISKANKDSIIETIDKLLIKINKKIPVKNITNDTDAEQLNNLPIIQNEQQIINTLPITNQQPERPQVNPKQSEQPQVNPKQSEQPQQSEQQNNSLAVPDSVKHESDPLNNQPNILGGIDPKIIQQQLLHQKKIEIINTTKQNLELNELQKIKRMKEEEEERNKHTKKQKA
jgi:hypothetical protein